MKSPLRLMMDNVDAIGVGSDRPGPRELPETNETAHRAEVHPDIPSMAERLLEDDLRRADEPIEMSMKDAAAGAARKRGEALADGNTVVSRAIRRAGLDTTAWPPAAALYAEAIGKMLLEVQNADRPGSDSGFSATSSADEIARGAAVGAVLGERNAKL